MSGNPKDRNGLEQGKGNKTLPIYGINDLSECYAAAVLCAQGEVGVGAFVDGHKGRAKGQIHGGGGCETD